MVFGAIVIIPDIKNYQIDCLAQIWINMDNFELGLTYVIAEYPIVWIVNKATTEEIGGLYGYGGDGDGDGYLDN